MAQPETYNLEDTAKGSDKRPVEYSVLTPDGFRTKLETREELHEKYLMLLNPLIEKIIGREGQPGYDTVVFLDKSARPLAWMLRKFWPYMAPQEVSPETGKPEVVPMPPMRFVNIDRIDWRKDPELEIEEGGAREIEERDIGGLRSVFQLRHGDGEELVPNPANEMDDKRILIVDEQSETGDTLKAARRLFERAFPTSEIETTAWIFHPYEVGKRGQRESKVKEIPMWYPPRDEKGHHKDTGRGVLSPVHFDPDDPEHRDPLRFPPESYQFLSTKPYVQKTKFTKEEQLDLAELRRHAKQAAGREKKLIEKKIRKLRREKDPESVQLRREIGQMVVDFVEGRIHPMISATRQEILGMDPMNYNRRARDNRAARQRHP